LASDRVAASTAALVAPYTEVLAGVSVLAPELTLTIAASRGPEMLQRFLRREVEPEDVQVELLVEELLRDAFEDLRDPADGCGTSLRTLWMHVTLSPLPDCSKRPGGENPSRAIARPKRVGGGSIASDQEEYEPR
jgi:hypothetical protein